MNTRRLRPKWTLGTMLILVGWSSVVLWLNVRPRVQELEAAPITKSGGGFVDSEDPTQMWMAEYGFPWRHAFAFWDAKGGVSDDSPLGLVVTSFKPSGIPVPRLPLSEYRLISWRLAGNIAIGLLAVFILTWTSKYHLRAILSALRATMSKPPPENLNGD